MTTELTQALYGAHNLQDEKVCPTGQLIQCLYWPCVSCKVQHKQG